MHLRDWRHALRVLAWLLPLLLFACGEEPPPPASYPPLSYSYLTPLRLNVASIEIENRAVPTGPDDVAALSPVTPVAALEQMAHDRLFAAGTSGSAVFVIDDASILRQPDGALSGSLAVHLNIDTAAGHRAAYAEARVSRIRTPGGDEDLRTSLYQLTKQMLDDMNVEFEYQIRRSLKDWLLSSNPTASPAPVQQQPLPPPGAGTAPPSSSLPLLPPASSPAPPAPPASSSLGSLPLLPPPTPISPPGGGELASPTGASPSASGALPLLPPSTGAGPGGSMPSSSASPSSSDALPLLPPPTPGSTATGTPPPTTPSSGTLPLLPPP